ncbi:hypothetical protein [Parabacteroides distasonis]|uniref:hypothetical protein n=1 Tax=Parabacteroides distasonis TaxID=823 RepID=UPI0018A0BA95|nr:hypothetical protein [Parabacteroides distasonis]MDB9150252.1 hypothetical protein [Parabacteroides distasonis]MDB9154793.1 hypothetical protein [Parabacteroides distasonis]MDB9164509.1 hypothetical protein [Parabacteroides distasonis]MDB9168541.1 hypothetical protein [Parabacteroides distasonis]MDB9193094.1 hypothetical protein [Parabacteroides distasonis]
MVRKLIGLVFTLFVCMGIHAQFSVTAHQEGWDRIPPGAQKDGFWLQQSVLVNMDDDDTLEEVMLFGKDNGHYPQFDLFKFYYVIVDDYTKEIQYISDEVYVTDKYELTVEDRNNDGISELYIHYFKDGKFVVDERGYNLQTVRCHDRIEWHPGNKNIKAQ